MGWSVGGDLDAHRRAVAAFLAADPVGVTGQATLLASLANGVRWSDEPPVFAVHRDSVGRVDAAGVRTPPKPLHLDGAADPAGLVAAVGPDVPAVNGPEPVARAFAAAWADAYPTTVREAERLHLLALPGPDALRPPPAAAGTARAATPDDLPRVQQLITAMRAEVGETGPTPPRIAVDRVAAGLLWVVDGDDGPVATANATRPAAGVSRVAGVYTQPEFRGRGLAAVATAAVTRAAYGAGAAHVCLFTQAGNPTSNGVYERLGYRRRPTDRVVLRFGPPAVPTLG